MAEGVEGVRDPVAFYRTHAAEFDAERSRELCEKPWLDAFLAQVPKGGSVLDLGCGAGDPIKSYIAGQGFALTGLDSTPAFIELARERLPDCEWIEADMREFDLARRFDGIIAWHSFFHLTAQAQRDCIRCLAAHASANAVLMFTSGPEHGEAVNPLYGEPLYHASLSPDEYRELLAKQGFSVLRHVAEDPECGHATVWLAKRGT